MSKDKTPSLFDYTPPPASGQAEQGGRPAMPPASGRGNAAEYSVTELSTALKRSIEDQFGHVRVRGELSRVTVAKSGHMYSSLKDDGAVLDAVCWRGTMQRLGLVPEEGMEVICTGKLTTYPGRSNYQLIIERMELAGEGALLKMLEERKKRLAAEGLFDERRKKALPFLPRCIGVITSPTGAVIRDILHRITERFPSHVLLWPVMVQGEGASAQVKKAVIGFNNMPQGFEKPDVLIVARGGGSLEDLMPFNDEELVRSIAESEIPVISAVGHETDVTLVDFASDRRAPTPTAAAEMAVPVRSDWLYTVSDYEARMRRTASRQLQYNAERLKMSQSFMALYPQYIEQKQQHIDFISTKAVASMREVLSATERRLSILGGRLAAVSPSELLHRQERHVQSCALDAAFKQLLSYKAQKSSVASARLAVPARYLNALEKDIVQINKNFMRQMTVLFDTKEQSIKASSRMLESLSFKKVLERGYSVIRDERGKVLSSVKDALQQDAVTAYFVDGDLELKVKK